MAEATKNRKRTRKDSLTEKPSAGGHDPAQPNLPGVEEDRISGVEASIKRILNAQKERAQLKEEIDDAKTKIVVLLKKNNRTQYKALGKLFILEPGADVLRIKKVKES